MRIEERDLYLDIFDYSGNKICSLYDQKSDVAGQAYDVVVSTERNGWRELSFSVPSVYAGDEGNVENYRINYLKADYRIRLMDGKCVDWFLISEPKVTHKAFSKDISVSAGHISQLLKIKNLGLVFSDDEGNNVGTARQLLETILEGTGWEVGSVSTFYEKDGKTEKVRSLKASAKTGAFKLISSMCDLFDAKPTYRCEYADDGKTIRRIVDILPINPFSEPKDGELPDVTTADGVVELHYGKNINGLTRTLSTENLVTKLYAYGSYGDKTNGYCGIDECEHTEYIFKTFSELKKGTTYYFSIQDDEDIEVVYNFIPSANVPIDSELVFSLMDPASQMYLWNRTAQIAYPVEKGTRGSKIDANASKEKQKNWFSFIMDFRYYREVGLLSNEMLQAIAEYQQNAGDKYEAVHNAALEMAKTQTTLSETIGSVNFVRLDALYDESFLYTKLHLNKNVYSDGVIYRTDYDAKKKDIFEWRTTDSLKENGDPTNQVASMVFIVHATNPVTWDKAFLKEMDDEDNPSVLTLWAASGTMRLNQATDRIYLFELNNINGYLGTYESMDEAVLESLASETKIVTTQHPVYFSKIKPVSSIDASTDYGWWWQYDDWSNNSKMYFWYYGEGDTDWNPVFFLKTDPTRSCVVPDRSYWFDWSRSMLFRRNAGTWVVLETVAEERVAKMFSTVYRSGMSRDRYFKGLYDSYTYSVQNNLPINKYYFKTDYDLFWVFSTVEPLSNGDTLTYRTKDGWIEQLRNGVTTTIEAKTYRFDSVEYHSSNVLSGLTVEKGSISTTDGSSIDADVLYRSAGTSSVYPNTDYLINGFSSSVTVHMYDGKKIWRGCITVQDASNSQFKTSGTCKFIKLVVPADASSFKGTEIITAKDADSTIVVDDENYYLLAPLSPAGEQKGLIPLVKKFADTADATYLTTYQVVKQCQDVISALELKMTNLLGDMYREGYWQKTDYVDGDETKLYDDALDNLVHIAKPEAKYNIDYLDLYNSNISDNSYGVFGSSANVSWQDLSISSAVHLIDEEIDVNTWAYIDKIQKCYDQPQKTKISINTNLTTMTQHSFTDVMSNIANVASQLVGKTTIYDNTSNSSITSGMIVTGSQILNGSISGSQLASGSIGSLQIGDFAITNAKIDNAAITNAKIENAAITSAKIEDAAITNAKIENAAISSAKIEDAAITSAKIEDAAITNAKIKDAAITDAKIKNATITSAKIANATITSANIANSAITNANIKDAAISTAKIENGAITTALIHEEAVGTAQIANASITDAKVVDLSANSITAGTLSVERLVLIGDEKSLVYSINNAIINAATTEEEERKAVSVSTLDGGTLTEKTVTADKLVAKSITSEQIASSTITSNEIAANTIVAANINVVELMASEAFIGQLTTDRISSTLGGSLDLSSNQSITSVVSDSVDEAIGYRIDITSTTDVLTDAVKSTTLVAHVWHGKTEVTETISESSFAWKRFSSDTLGDIEWNNNSAHHGIKSITVNTSDVKFSANYICEIDI